jgi:hypothetical protein
VPVLRHHATDPTKQAHPLGGDVENVPQVAIFVFWGHPTAVVTIVIAVLLVVLGFIELIGRPPPQPAPTRPATSG